MKECSICKETKPLSDFHFISNSRTKYRAGCKKCHANIRKRKRKIEKSLEWYRRRYERVKLSAFKRGIGFELSLQDIKDILKPDDCYYCEQPTKNKSVDRVNNQLPYQARNCVMACYECNYIKRTLTFEQIEMFYLKMKNRAV